MSIPQYAIDKASAAFPEQDAAKLGLDFYGWVKVRNMLARAIWLERLEVASALDWSPSDWTPLAGPIPKEKLYYNLAETQAPATT